MKKLLNTVYITTPCAALRKDGENLVVEMEKGDPPVKEKRQLPLHMIGSVVAFAPVHISPALVGDMAAKGICCVLLGFNGKFQARIEGPISGNVLLRRAQYKMSDTPEDIIHSILIGKIANQRAVLQRFLRDYGAECSADNAGEIEHVVKQMVFIMQYVEKQSLSADQLRGKEGEAAQLYFSVFDYLIRSPDEDMRWTKRSRRPPLDPVNALLSFLYTLLTHDCRAACESVGLDPAVGFLHRDRPGRPSLALDLMEELRPVFADRLALSLINRRQVRAQDFKKEESGAVLMSDEARKTVLQAWQERKKEERLHEFIGEKAPYGLVPFLQAQLMARHLRSDLEAYPPWFWK
ncbi:type I-C CRISPR-associated endonuclease Cas1c [Candidatus Tokpelaia sp.]|uniref:type I-C CRISPR-associated endonuclease Cas1c n=1 Tax=Candidatus Tokpelaia sp. TaxID=2233777 RepID=UPI001238B294|nr:type I-C CRISPR-associated endonuclease Cas1c [Candidatus Tokpelaia sp.]KAA6404668.1 subtype I-C CRISPR-associated endonuclease Cas1 [Candidatus Tokpelaia sp.]